MIQFFARLFRAAEPRKSIAVRPSRTLELQVPFDAAFDRCKVAVLEVLGAIVREEDRLRGYIESSPGLLFSERICFALEPLGSNITRVTIESRRIAGADLPPESSDLAGVAAYLLRA